MLHSHTATDLRDPEDYSSFSIDNSMAEMMPHYVLLLEGNYRYASCLRRNKCDGLCPDFQYSLPSDSLKVQEQNHNHQIMQDFLRQLPSLLLVNLTLEAALDMSIHHS